ncbi:hypothetical protein GOODEAATRI_004190, partial [Goodea atripinnis]
TSSHEKVVSMLQGSGAMPTLVVEEGPPTFPLAEQDLPGGGAPTERARSPVLSSLQWVADILPPSIRVQGRTFGQQLEHLLTIQERYTICKALENFFQHRFRRSLKCFFHCQQHFQRCPPSAEFYPPGLTNQNSGESNPYISLDSPPPSPLEQDFPSSPPVYRSNKRRYTFSKPPRSEDTDRFLDALSEQLGQRVAIVDDFLNPDNDYEEPHQPTLSTFQPLPQLHQSQHQVQSATQTGRPQSQPSHHLLQSQQQHQAQAHNKQSHNQSQPQSLPHSISDPTELLGPPPPPPLPPPCSPPPLPRPSLSRMDSHHMSVKRLRWEQVENSEGTIWGQVLMNMAADRLEAAHIKQLLLYAPDAEEVKKYEEYREDPSKLSEPDQFMLQVQS